jgi:hypothetical protein
MESGAFAPIKHLVFQQHRLGAAIGITAHGEELWAGRDGPTDRAVCRLSLRARTKLVVELEAAFHLNLIPKIDGSVADLHADVPWAGELVLPKHLISLWRSSAM